MNKLAAQTCCILGFTAAATTLALTNHIDGAIVMCVFLFMMML